MRKKEFVALGLVFVMCGSLWTGQAGIVCAAGTGAEYENLTDQNEILSENGKLKSITKC